MKYSELPQKYRDLEIPKNAVKNYFDDIVADYHFFWGQTNEGGFFWSECYAAQSIEELPPLPEKEFVLTEKWCVKSFENSDVHKWFEKNLERVVTADKSCYFNYPELENKICTTVDVKKGYTEITYDQWVKYVRDASEINMQKKADQIESEFYKNDNVEKITNTLDYITNNLNIIKEIRDTVKSFQKGGESDKEEIMQVEFEPPFYMIYVDGASGSTKKHDRNSAITEAKRLSKETDKKVFILRSEYCFERKVNINMIPIKKD